jgi:hypothetical protein
MTNSKTKSVNRRPTKAYWVIEVDELKDITQCAIDGAAPDDEEGVMVTSMSFAIADAKYDFDGEIQLELVGVQDSLITESQVKPPTEAVSVDFNFTCEEFVDDASVTLRATDEKETEHHINLRLAGHAAHKNWFIQAIQDHDSYYPNHVIVDVHVGGIEDIPTDELKKNPIVEGKPTWARGHIDE